MTLPAHQNACRTLCLGSSTNSSKNDRLSAYPPRQKAATYMEMQITAIEGDRIFSLSGDRMTQGKTAASERASVYSMIHMRGAPFEPGPPYASRQPGNALAVAGSGGGFRLFV